MARKHYWQYLLDDNGNPIEDADVRIFLAGTTQEADIYVHPEWGNPTTSSAFGLQTNALGFFEIWFGDIWEVAGGYSNDQLFDIQWTKGSFTQTLENFLPFAPLFPVDITDTDKDRNKLISNAQGNKWDTHTDEIVPSASPHNIKPVIFFSIDTTYNKVVSDKLGYQMYQMADTASLQTLDTSAARYQFGLETLSASGSEFYADISHVAIPNDWPIVRVYKASNFAEVTPKKVVSLGRTSTRILLDDNISVWVVIIG